MFSKKQLGLVVLAALLLGFVVGGAVLAQGSAPGSEVDPLVAKSYVDKFLRLEVVNLQRGQSLIAEGGTEIILRGGRGVAIASPLGGLCDVTQGRDLAGGEVIPANHLLIVPRDDGRGVKAETDTILMVRGGYWVQ
ncbi:MAG: hypothetical protein WAQ41_02965 [bacterium]|jgi:hypothetical protein|nr:hypothetical protein [Bacillota bacterium]HHW55635.1 hypothetical protein [Bacillota bacterium]